MGHPQHNGRVTTPKPKPGPNRDAERVCVAFSRPSHPSGKFTASLDALKRLDILGGVGPDGRRIGGHGRIWLGGAQIEIEAGAEITRTRNEIVRQFLAIDRGAGRAVDWLWMVDADMVFDPDILERLIEAAHPTLRPVMGALCFSFQADAPYGRQVWPTLYDSVPPFDRLRRLTQYPVDTLIPVAGTGAACVLIHRSVLEAMTGQWERWHPPRTFYAATPFCELGGDGEPDWRTGDEYSEDLTFCLRAQALGFPIHVHTGIKCGHVKEVVVDEAMFLAESEALHQACVPALPTYAVIASKDRPEMLRTLITQLRDQVTDIFVMDNGYDDKVCEAWVHWVPCRGEPLHRMWNQGLELAEQAAGEVVGGGPGTPYNVLVINDDVTVETALCAKLEAALRCSDDHWLAYPEHRGVELPPEGFARTQSEAMASQTHSGWCAMMRGEVGLRYVEGYQWWYGDSDLEARIRAEGKYVVAVNAGARHLDPLRSTLEDPERLAQAEADEARYAEKWGLDPSTLWLAQRKAGVA